jgi:PmbA protein
MNNKERLELAHWAAGECKKAGADDATVGISYDRTVSVEHRDRKIDNLSEATQNSMSVTIYLGGRYSSHSTNDLRKDTLGDFIQQAVAMTKFLSPDPDRCLTDAKYCQGLQRRDLKILDPAYGSVTAEDRVRMAKECEDAALSKSDKIVSCTGSYSDSFSEYVLVMTNGFEGESSTTSFSASADATLKGADGVLNDDYEYGGGHFRRDIPTAAYLGQRAVERATAQMGQVKMESGVYDMIVENRVASRLIGSTLGALNGQNIYRKNSFLIDKLGQKIGCDKLTIIDDPFIESGAGSSLFDGDGIPSKRRVIIDKGVLQTYLIDWFYSRKMKTEPTGASTCNLVYEYGDKSLDGLIAQAKKAILVRSFIGGNSNGTTGDFSYGVIGQYVEDGKIIRPINEMNVSGNYLNLWNQLVELGNDAYVIAANRRPSLYFKDLQFAGK